MNNVQKLTQENYRVEPGQKQAECTECTAQGQPARPARASAAPCRAPTTPCREPPAPCHSRLPPSCLRAPRALPCCSARLRAQLPAAPARAPTHACPRAHARLPARPTHALCAQRLPSQRPAPSAPFLPQSRYNNCIVTQPISPYSHNTLYCIVIQPQPTLPIAIHYSVLQYTFLTAHARPPFHDTINFCNEFFFSFLQYKWAVAHCRFFGTIFFFQF